MSTTSSLLSLASLAVAGYGIYYLYTNGYVDKILGALKLPSTGGGSKDTGGSTDTGGTDTGGTTTPPASTCKSGEYMSAKLKKCVKTPTCKSGQTFDEKTEKCAKTASGGMAQIVSHGYVAEVKGWRPHNFRVTVA